MKNGVMLRNRSQRWLWLRDVRVINYTTTDFYAASCLENDANFAEKYGIWSKF